MSEGVLAEFFSLRSFYDYYAEVDWVMLLAFPVLACLENHKLMVLRLILNRRLASLIFKLSSGMASIAF